MRNKWITVSFYLLLLLSVCGFLFWMKSCETKLVNKEVGKVEEGLVGKVGWTPTITIIPNNVSRLHEGATGIVVERIGEEIRTAGNISSIPGEAVSGSTVSARLDNSRSVSLSDFGSRRRILWSGSDGHISYKWYWFALGLGISYQTNGQHPGLGIDIRGLYVGDFGLQGGVGFYHGQKAVQQISIGYNLRRIKAIDNTDLIIGMSGDKSIFGGIRCELGNAL
jgi:hypothetical protein